MISMSGGFVTKLQAQANQPRIRLLFYEDDITDTSIAFNENGASADSITDSNDGFVAAGFQDDDEIIVSGSTSNNGHYTIDTVAVGTLTLIATDDLADEAAGDTVTIQAARAGDYDSYVLGVSQLRRDTRLSTGMVTVRLANTDQQWNNFITTLTDTGKIVAIKLYFSGDTELMPLFVGKMEKAQYVGAEAILHIRDKFAELMEIPIGSGQAPVSTWYGSSVNPGELVWDILTNASYGNLDGTEGAGNVDIDFAGWTNWNDDYCEAQDFRVEARLTGHTIRTVLQEVAYITSSFISVNALGKLDFHPTYNTGTGLTFGVSDCTDINMDVAKDDICNKIQMFFGYDPPTDTWAGSYTDNTSNDATQSQSDYGVKSVIEEGKAVWHANQTSADNADEQILNAWAHPIKPIIVTATMKGFACEIGDEVEITEPLKGLSSDTMLVDAISSIRIPQGTIDLSGRITS